MAAKKKPDHPGKTERYKWANAIPSNEITTPIVESVFIKDNNMPSASKEGENDVIVEFDHTYRSKILFNLN